MFVLDRETGELLSADKYEPVTWANGYDLKTGLPDINMDKRTHIGHYATDICPSSTGAKDFIPSSFSPRTGLLYIPAHNTCMDYEGTEANYIAGTPYLGAERADVSRPRRTIRGNCRLGCRAAEKVWGIKDKDLPVYAGVLATGGDLVFYGTMEGWFRAVDAHTGKILWQAKTGSGIVGRSDYISWSRRQAIRRHFLGNRRLDGSNGAAIGLDRTTLTLRSA